jgi:hypothetical protein
MHRRAFLATSAASLIADGGIGVSPALFDTAKQACTGKHRLDRIPGGWRASKPVFAFFSNLLVSEPANGCLSTVLRVNINGHARLRAIPTDADGHGHRGAGGAAARNGNIDLQNANDGTWDDAGIGDTSSRIHTAYLHGGCRRYLRKRGQGSRDNKARVGGNGSGKQRRIVIAFTGEVDANGVADLGGSCGAVQRDRPGTGTRINYRRLAGA